MSKFFRAQSICNRANNMGHSSIYIVGSQDMKKRLAAIDQLKSSKCRILFSTDLTARGIDAENVNLVINIDIPVDGATYLHRIGRAGRYGSHGIAISIISEKEQQNLRDLMLSVGGPNFSLLKLSNKHLKDIWVTSDTELEQFFASNEDEKENPQIDIYNDNNSNDVVQLTEHNDLKQSVDEKCETNGHNNDTIKSVINSNEPVIENASINNCRNPTDAGTGSIATYITEKSLNNITIDEFINNIYPKMEIDLIERAIDQIKTPINTGEKILVINLKSATDNQSMLHKLNDNTIFTVDLSNLSDNEQCNFDSNDIFKYLSYDICEKELQTETKLDRKECKKRNSFVEDGFIPVDIINHIDTADSVIIDYHNYLERLLVASENEKNNVNLNSEDSVLREVRLWNESIECELERLEKASRADQFYIKDTGRIWLYQEYCSMLEIFLKIQKQALLCVYPELRNDTEITETYSYSANNCDRLVKMYKIIENFKEKHRETGKNLEFNFPYPYAFNSHLPNLMMSDVQRENYDISISYFLTNVNLRDQLLKLKKSLFNFSKTERTQLEEKIIAMNIEKLEIDQLLKIVNKQKLNKKIQINVLIDNNDNLAVDKVILENYTEIIDTSHVNEKIQAKTKLKKNKKINHDIYPKHDYKSVPIRTNNIRYNVTSTDEATLSDSPTNEYIDQNSFYHANNSTNKHNNNQKYDNCSVSNSCNSQIPMANQEQSSYNKLLTDNYTQYCCNKENDSKNPYSRCHDNNYCRLSDNTTSGMCDYNKHYLHTMHDTNQDIEAFFAQLNIETEQYQAHEYFLIMLGKT